MLNCMITRQSLAVEIRGMGQTRRGSEVPLHAARMVATFIVRRWEGAGVQGFMLDAERRPVPVSKTLQHLVKEARFTSPSGKTLFYCSRCGSTPLPLSPSGFCPGELTPLAVAEIADQLVRGVLYAPREPGGLPLPPEAVELAAAS